MSASICRSKAEQRALDLLEAIKDADLLEDRKEYMEEDLQRSCQCDAETAKYLYIHIQREFDNYQPQVEWRAEYIPFANHREYRFQVAHRGDVICLSDPNHSEYDEADAQRFPILAAAQRMHELLKEIDAGDKFYGSDENKTLTAILQEIHIKQNSFLSYFEYVRQCHENGEPPCIDTQGHKFVTSDEDENVAYCEKCATSEF